MIRRRAGADVRKGGMDTPRGFLFELSGGRLCLDFANTVDRRPSDLPRELLGSYADLASWGVQAGAITRQEGLRLLRRAGREPAAAARVLEQVRAVREAIFAIASDLADRRPARREALAILDGALPAALGRLRLVQDRGRFTWGWGGGDEDLDRVLWPVVRSTAELLTSGDPERVRRCAGDDCAWLFIDRSRNGTRRWCDMTVCGNRSKARRFYRRTRNAG